MSDIYVIDPSSHRIIDLIGEDWANENFHKASGFPYIRVICESEQFTERWDGRHDEDIDEMVQRFFDWSLGKRISSIEHIRAGRDSGVLGYEIEIDDSKDGRTNITPEVIDTFRRLLEDLK